MDLVQILLKRVDAKGLLLEDLFDGVLMARLQEVVDSTDNSLDNSVKELLEPVLRSALEKWLDDKMAELQAPGA